MRTAVLVLSKPGLDLARGLRSSLPGETRVFGPSCVVGACGGSTSIDDARLGSTFPTSELGVFGWVGSIRKVVPSIQEWAEVTVALMPTTALTRLVIPGTLGTIHVAVDDEARRAVSLQPGEVGESATRRIASALGATAIFTSQEEEARD